MMQIIAVPLLFLVAITVSEFLQRGKRLQTSLFVVLSVYGLLGLGAALLLRWTLGTSIVTVVLFWAGAFLAWFGIRSHIESSILLYMLFLLKVNPGPVLRDRLMNLHETHYGPDRRLEALSKGSFIELREESVMLTTKGRFVVKAIKVVTRAWPDGCSNLGKVDSTSFNPCQTADDSSQPSSIAAEQKES